MSVPTVDPNKHSSASDPVDFNLVLGGPLYQLLVRARLSDDAHSHLLRRITVIPLLAWAPLLFFTLLEGTALGTKVAVPFILDIENHSRYLVALPLLIYAELLVNTRMRPLVRQFMERNLVADQSKLGAALESAIRLRNSVVAELILIGTVYAAGFLWRQHMVLGTATWYSTIENGRHVWTWTGLWYSYISLPIFQFILLRWYFRIFIWARFLWQIACTKLNLIPTHPDRAGGLGFLGNIAYAFTPLLVAHGALLSGMIANRIFFTGAKVTDFKMEIFTTIFVLLLIVLTPLLVFLPQLNRAKRTGLREYGVFAQRYTAAFDRKWIRENSDDELLGSGDIQSLADLGNSFQTIREMRMIPFTKETIFQLAIVTLVPLLPLLLTMFSLEELLGRFLRTVF